jgi:hypothetical protein
MTMAVSTVISSNGGINWPASSTNISFTSLYVWQFLKKEKPSEPNINITMHERLHTERNMEH